MLLRSELFLYVAAAVGWPSGGMVFPPRLPRVFHASGELVSMFLFSIFHLQSSGLFWDLLVSISYHTLRLLPSPRVCLELKPCKLSSARLSKHFIGMTCPWFSGVRCPVQIAF